MSKLSFYFKVLFMFLCKINQLSNHINLGQFTEIYWDGISQEWVQFYTFSLSFVLTFSSPSSVLPSYLFSIIRSYLFSPFFRPTVSPPPSFNLLLPFLPSYLFSHFVFPSLLPLQTSNYLYHTLQASYQCRIYSVSRNMVFQSE